VSSYDDLLHRLQKLGAGSLAPAELLAVLIGGEEDDGIDKSHQLVSSLGGIRRMADIAPADLAGVGADPAGAARVIAAMELARRVVQAGLGERTSIAGPADAAAVAAQEFRHLRDEKREHLCALYLDTKNNILGKRTISIGALDTTVVHPREVFREAVREGASSVIVVHNHPSGDPTPSDDDIEVTRRLAEAGRTLGIDLLDHVILGDNSHVSLKEEEVL
jgi:DNA repair protein RadC